MKVKLIEELFGADVYCLDMTDSALVFAKETGKKFEIPFAELRHFNLEGRGADLKRFLLETDSKSYEGSFLSYEDAKEFISFMRKKSGCYIDVRLDME